MCSASFCEVFAHLAFACVLFCAALTHWCRPAEFRCFCVPPLAEFSPFHALQTMNALDVAISEFGELGVLLKKLLDLLPDGGE